MLKYSKQQCEYYRQVHHSGASDVENWPVKKTLIGHAIHKFVAL